MAAKNIVEEYIKAHPGSEKLHRRGEKRPIPPLSVISLLVRTRNLYLIPLFR